MAAYVAVTRHDPPVKEGAKIEAIYRASHTQTRMLVLYMTKGTVDIGDYDAEG